MFYILMYLRCVHTLRGCAQVWRSEDNHQESVLSFHHLGSGDETRVDRLGGRNFYPLSHFSAQFSLISNEMKNILETLP